jgi:hypothetical protein
MLAMVPALSPAREPSACRLRNKLSRRDRSAVPSGAICRLLDIVLLSDHRQGAQKAWSFDPCQAPPGILPLPNLQIFRFGHTGTAVLLLPTRPGEQQRCSTLTPEDLLALTGDESTVWELLEAVRRLDRQALDEWTLDEPQRHQHGVVSSVEWEEIHVGRCDGDLRADPDALYVKCSSRTKPSPDALLSGRVLKERDKVCERVCSRDMAADWDLLGRCVRSALQRCESSDEQTLKGSALVGYWHLAARLGQNRLDEWCDDGQGKYKRLRVCQLKGHVFRARSRKFHPRLPREGVQALIGDHHVGAFLGPLVEPMDPFSARARASRFYAACQECGDLFTGATGSKEYCTRHDTDAARKRRSRQRVVERR